MKKDQTITFARWGNYTIAFKGLFEQLGFKVILPPKPNPNTVADGAKAAPELFCFPMKVTLGGYMAAIKEGADAILSLQNVGGSCRQKYYGVIQDKVLKDSGYKVKFIDLRATPREIYRVMKENTVASDWLMAKAFYLFFQKLFLIERIEQMGHRLRPRETSKGETQKIIRGSYAALEKAVTLKDLLKLKKEILGRLENVKLDMNKTIFKVGVIGEIYTVTDPNINFELEENLGVENVEIHRQMNVSYHLKKLLFPWIDWYIQYNIRSYLGSTVGGHGRDAIFEMLSFIKNDFDGVVHLLPFGCMPEVTVRPILEKLRQENHIPFLSLSLDEQVAEAGINTRLEAFADVVRNYHYNRERKKQANAAKPEELKTANTQNL